MSKKCAKCEKTVYTTEELNCLDKIWHKACFRCWQCGMALTMKNYKGYNKLPYCSAHYPQTKATVVTNTPEQRRLVRNSQLQSQAVYHADFERNIKGMLTVVADCNDTNRSKEIANIVSKVASTTTHNKSDTITASDNNTESYVSDLPSLDSDTDYCPTVATDNLTTTPAAHTTLQSSTAPTDFTSNKLPISPDTHTTLQSSTTPTEFTSNKLPISPDTHTTLQSSTTPTEFTSNKLPISPDTHTTLQSSTTPTDFTSNKLHISPDTHTTLQSSTTPTDFTSNKLPISPDTHTTLQSSTTPTDFTSNKLPNKLPISPDTHTTLQSSTTPTDFTSNKLPNKLPISPDTHTTLQSSTTPTDYTLNKLPTSPDTHTTLQSSTTPTDFTSNKLPNKLPISPDTHTTLQSSTTPTQNQQTAGLTKVNSSLQSTTPGDLTSEQCPVMATTVYLCSTTPMSPTSEQSTSITLDHNAGMCKAPTLDQHPTMPASICEQCTTTPTTRTVDQCTTTSVSSTLEYHSFIPCHNPYIPVARMIPVTANLTARLSSIQSLPTGTPPTEHSLPPPTALFQPVSLVQSPPTLASEAPPTGTAPTEHSLFQPVSLVKPPPTLASEAPPMQAGEPSSVEAASIRSNKGAMFVAMYDYEAQDDDEASFVENDHIVRLEMIDEGWMYGLVERTGLKGLIPANYIELAE